MGWQEGTASQLALTEITQVIGITRKLNHTARMKTRTQFNGLNTEVCVVPPGLGHPAQPPDATGSPTGAKLSLPSLGQCLG